MRQRITITGGSGYVGQLLRRRLSRSAYDGRVFDQYRGPLIDVLRRRSFGSRTGTPSPTAWPWRFVTRRSRLSVEKAQRLLGFEPFVNRKYIDKRLVW